MGKLKIRKGFDIRIGGRAERRTASAVESRIVGLVPQDFKGIKVKLLLKEGDEVKGGTAVYLDKNRPAVKFCSPVSGKIRSIEYGERRSIQSIVIESDEKNESISYRKYSHEALQKETAEELKTNLLEAGLWPHIRQRPFDTIADPEGKPKSIFISLADSSPLAASAEYLSGGRIDELNAALAVLGKLTEGRVNVTVKSGSSLLGELKHCELHEVEGPHPSGNVGIHIHHLDPISRGETVWYMNIRGLLAWGAFFLSGVYPSGKLMAAAGLGIGQRAYFPVTEGVMLKDIPLDAVDGGSRWISGDILTGRKRKPEGYLGYYDSLVTVLPEKRERKLLGWIAPGLKSYSFSKTFLSALVPAKEYDLTTAMHGGLRSFVQTGLFEQVLPMDIYPDFLIKSILAEDIAEMEGLGIYEVSEEDFALCSFVDPSKNDICGIIRQGLELIEKEG